MPTALSRELAPLIEAAGFGGKGGVTRLHRLLVEKHGVASSLQATSYWLKGDRNPKLAHLMALLDALAVPEPKYSELIRLSAQDERQPSPNRSPLDEDDIETVDVVEDRP